MKCRKRWYLIVVERVRDSTGVSRRVRICGRNWWKITEKRAYIILTYSH